MEGEMGRKDGRGMNGWRGLAKGWKGLYGWKGAGSDREVMKGNLDSVLVGMLACLFVTTLYHIFFVGPQLTPKKVFIFILETHQFNQRKYTKS